MCDVTENYIKLMHCSIRNSEILLQMLTGNPMENEIERRSLIAKCQIVQDALVNIVGIGAAEGKDTK